MSRRGGIDDKDRKLIEILRKNSRTPKTKLGRAVGLKGTAISSRLERLQQKGYISKFTIFINEKKTCYKNFIYLFVKVKPKQDKYFADLVKKDKDVIFCDSISSDKADFVLYIGCMSEDHEREIIYRVRETKGVIDTATYYRIESLKDYDIHPDRLIE